MLNLFDVIPDGFLEAESTDLNDVLGKPSLIQLPGENPQPLFISTLLHGNETTGFYALKSLLKAYSDRPLPRAMSIFIGNVEAAAQGVRRLDNQLDYNRAWPGTTHSDRHETDLLQTVAEIARKRPPFASIDIHNNTGQNPHYGCVNILNPHCLHLASRFSDITVYFTNPKGTQSSCFSDFCPAVVLECGQSGEADAVDHAFRYLQDILTMSAMPTGRPDGKLYHTVARVTVPETIDFDTSEGHELTLDTSLESRNFDTLVQGERFAGTSSSSIPLRVNNESNEDVTAEYFSIEDGNILLRRNITLSMYTTQSRAIRQDCLCYFMEEMSLG